jgi:hypothetical protein
MISTLAFVSLLATVPTYFFRGDVVVSPRRLRIEPSAGVHLAILLAVPFVVTALRLWFVDSAELLYSTTGPLVGASYTDLHATLPAIRVSAIAALAAALVVLVGGARRMLGWYGVLAVGGYVSVAILGRGIVPAIMQKFVVAPTELTRETPYLERHIAATRRAWGIDSVQSRDLEGVPTLTLASLRANAATIENVRLWDRAPLLRTFGQLQEIRTYYDFVSVDDDRTGSMASTAVLLAARAQRPVAAHAHVHQRAPDFTHGMGLTMSPVNQVTTQGLPVLLIQDLPPATTGSLKVSRPQIYYGELAQDFVFVGTRQKEFDYPAGEANINTAYVGKGGFPEGGLFRRMLLALHFGNSKVLLSGDITSESRVLYNRNIVTRIRKALPFLKLDRDPYLVVADDGTLKWIQDAYTTSSRYPYSFRSPDGVTYMRNSVKVVIDAYDGTVTAYVSAPNDPLVRTWAKVFPGVFVPIDSMAKDLRRTRYPGRHVAPRPPLKRITWTSLRSFTIGKTSAGAMVTRPDEAVLLVALICAYRLPWRPPSTWRRSRRAEGQPAAWMVARNDGAEYGSCASTSSRATARIRPSRSKTASTRTPRSVGRSRSGTSAGRRSLRRPSLSDRSRASVRAAALLQAEGLIPELKRVLVAYENQVVMRETPSWRSRRFAGGGDAPSRSSAGTVRSARRRGDTVAGPRAPNCRVSWWRLGDATRRPSRRNAKATGAAMARRFGDWASCWSAWGASDRGR